MTAGASGHPPAAPYAPTLEVGTDAKGDWGGGAEAGMVGDALGQDLVSAAIGMPNKDTVEFTIRLNSLPAIGGTPEVSRYTWDMLVDGNVVQLDGKFTNYTRGACDPTAGKCPPPRNPGLQPFSVRGDCSVSETGNVTVCKEIGLVQARFDAAAKTITVPVPATLIKANPCSAITAGVNIFGGSISAAPAAFATSSLFPLDTMELDTDDEGNPIRFVIPSGTEIACGEEAPAEEPAPAP